MSDSSIYWQFAPHVPRDRVDHLLSLTDFGAVLAALQCAHVEAFVWERAIKPHLLGCCRAAFRLRVSAQAYDAFFNSPVGYRAQYAASVAAGESANRQLLLHLQERLLQRAAQQSEVTLATVAASLAGAQAKIWIDEQEVEQQLGASEADLIFPKWGHELQGAGLLAPVGRLLEVKGGWLSANGAEVLNPEKALRGAQIRDEGFS